MTVQQCSFCGSQPNPSNAVVMGPGVGICSDCITLTRTVVDNYPGTPSQIELKPVGASEQVKIVAEVTRDGFLRLENIYRLHGADEGFLYNPENEPYEVQESGSLTLNMTPAEVDQLREILNPEPAVTCDDIGFDAEVPCDLARGHDGQHQAMTYW